MSALQPSSEPLKVDLTLYTAIFNVITSTSRTHDSGTRAYSELCGAVKRVLQLLEPDRLGDLESFDFLNSWLETFYRFRKAANALAKGFAYLDRFFVHNHTLPRIQEEMCTQFAWRCLDPFKEKLRNVARKMRAENLGSLLSCLEFLEDKMFSSRFYGTYTDIVYGALISDIVNKGSQLPKDVCDIIADYALHYRGFRAPKSVIIRYQNTVSYKIDQIDGWIARFWIQLQTASAYVDLRSPRVAF